jgi:hypothetical protein
MNVHRRVFLALALMVTGGAGSAASAADELTGVWSAQVRTKGGLGAQLMFTANGEATVTFGALVDLAYTIEGNRITMTGTQDSAARGEPMVEDFTIDGDSMRQRSVGSPENEKVFHRKGTPHADAPIIGDWTYPHPTGPTALVRYSREGIMQLSVPFQTGKGTYRLNGNVLELDVPGRPLAVFDIKREGRTLTLRERATGRTIGYRKFEY